MPLLLLVALLLIVPLVVVLLTPLALVQRYRAGTARRLARPWLASLNVFGLALSSIGFLIGTAVTGAWVAHAFMFAVLGFAAGTALGLVGVWLTRWEPSVRALHYTPNRWLVLAITVVVAGRVAYGFWRSWSVARAGADVVAAVYAIGIAESLGAGALVLGYYLVYWIGIRRRIQRWQRRRLRVKAA